jgi:hypothetical protein
MPEVDPRFADFSVESPSLRPYVEAAVADWRAAGATLDWREQPCQGPPRACVAWQWGTLPGGLAGSTRRRTDYSDAVVTIDLGVPAYWVPEVVTHEAGHVMGLHHVTDPADLMRASGFGPWCVGESTAAEWAWLWNEPLNAAYCSERE